MTISLVDVWRCVREQSIKPRPAEAEAALQMSGELYLILAVELE